MPKKPAIRPGWTPLTQEQIGRIPELLLKYTGNMSAVGRELGITRSTVKHHVDRHPQWRQLRENIVQTAVDTAEQNLFSAAEQGNMTAVIFLLKTQGRDRGYVERRELTLPSTDKIGIALDELDSAGRIKLQARLESGEPVERILADLDVE